MALDVILVIKQEITTPLMLTRYKISRNDAGAWRNRAPVVTALFERRRVEMLSRPRGFACCGRASDLLRSTTAAPAAAQTHSDITAHQRAEQDGETISGAPSARI